MRAGGHVCFPGEAPISRGCLYEIPLASTQCACCWAFASLAAIESKFLIAFGKKNSTERLDLSEQQLLDCVSFKEGYASQGCKGGYLNEAMAYASRQAAQPRGARPELLSAAPVACVTVTASGHFACPKQVALGA